VQAQYPRARGGESGRELAAVTREQEAEDGRRGQRAEDGDRQAPAATEVANARRQPGEAAAAWSEPDLDRFTRRD